MMRRRLLQEALTLLQKHSKETLDITPGLQRLYSSLPKDISQAAQRAKFPPRRHRAAAPPEGFIPGAAAAASDAAAEAAQVKVVKEGAKIGTKKPLISPSNTYFYNFLCCRSSSIFLRNLFLTPFSH